jgi:SOS response regulatory protein OraA/RecX
MSSSKRRHEASRTVTRLVRYVRTGVRSRQQLLTYLHRGGVPPRTAARLIAECEARGLVDDAAGARLWADHWARGGYGWAAIRAKLEARGFGARAIGAAGERAGLASEDESRARQLLAGRLRTGRGDRARLARALGSRGFDPDLSERLLDELTGHSVPS